MDKSTNRSYTFTFSVKEEVADVNRPDYTLQLSMGQIKDLKGQLFTLKSGVVLPRLKFEAKESFQERKREEEEQGKGKTEQDKIKEELGEEKVKKGK